MFYQMISKCSLLIAALLLLTNCNDDLNESPRQSPGFYAVSGKAPGIYDAQNRFALLRGVNYSVLGDYYQALPDVPSETEYDPIHIEQMASLGFNVIRLVLSWSELEPERGQYNQSYIQQIREIVNKAAEHDIYIILDMHQDAWGKYIASPADVVCPPLLIPAQGWDGAPEWATFTDNKTTCKLSLRELSPAVARAWQNFYQNREGIRDAFVDCWKFLVTEFAADPNIVGYDILNEPAFGEQIGYYGHDLFLGGLYTDVINGIRAAEKTVSGGFEHIIFFEPTGEWSAFSWTLMPNKSFTDDKNIVFAPHIYGGSITVLGNTFDGFRNAEIMANYYETTWFSGEWGWFGDATIDRPKVKKYAAYEDEYLVGGAYWQWIQACGDPHNISADLQSFGSTSQHLYNMTCPGDVFVGLFEPFTSILSRAYPRATPGVIHQLVSEPDEQMMTMKGEGKGVVDIWVPNRGKTPTVSGDISDVVIITKNSGFRVEGNINGSYEIEITY
jgi:endoglycosylceramidase